MWVLCMKKFPSCFPCFLHESKPDWPAHQEKIWVPKQSTFAWIEINQEFLQLENISESWWHHVSSWMCPWTFVVLSFKTEERRIIQFPRDHLISSKPFVCRTCVSTPEINTSNLFTKQSGMQTKEGKAGVFHLWDLCSLTFWYCSTGKVSHGSDKSTDLCFNFKSISYGSRGPL